MRILKLFLILMALGPAALAQGTGISLSRTDVDSRQPVEVTADNLTVTQTENTAVFEGNAKVVQGELVLTADSITVNYNATQSAIDTVEAKTNVIFTNGTEVAEAQYGVYTVAAGTIKLSGDVVLVQGPNAISGDTLSLDLATSKGTMSGNVKTVFVPEGDE